MNKDKINFDARENCLQPQPEVAIPVTFIKHNPDDEDDPPQIPQFDCVIQI